MKAQRRGGPTNDREPHGNASEHVRWPRATIQLPQNSCNNQHHCIRCIPE
jgi:hypothetical protein